MIKKITIISLVIALITIGISGFSNVRAENTITIAEGDWPGIRAKNAVISKIIENMGYNVEFVQTPIPITYQGLVEEDINIFLGAWLPAQQEQFEEVKGNIEKVGMNMTNCINIMGVPTYVYEAGVQTFKDLTEHAEKFDYKIYGGRSGWQAAMRFREAIENDSYGLGNWEVVNTSQAALLAHAQEAIEEEEWIVFPAWQPHWMNEILEFEYLNDPEGEIWEDPEDEVATLVNLEFSENHPQIYKFLEQLKIEVDTGSEWIHNFTQKEIPEEELAEQWLKNNVSSWIEWLKGIETKDGENAILTLIENIFELDT